MSVKLLAEHHLGYLSLKGGYTGSSESTLIKMPHCWKSHVALTVKPVIYIYIYALRHSVSLDHNVSGDQEKKRKIEYRQEEVMYSIMKEYRK